MEVDFALRANEIVQLLEEATPLRIHLTETDEDRSWVELERPKEVVLVPGSGVHVVTHGRIRHEIIGVAVPITIRQVQLAFVPEVVTTGGGQRLDFRIKVERADLELVPGLVEAVIMARVNQALEPARLGMFLDVGNVSKALSIPGRFEPLHLFSIAARTLHVAVTADALLVRATVGMELSRRQARPTDDRPKSEPRSDARVSAEAARIGAVTSPVD